MNFGLFMKMNKGKKIGYIRVSTVDQNPERQLENVSVDKKFIDYASGITIDRPQFKAMVDYVREDDIIIVHSIDRLARNVKHLLEFIETMNKKKVVIHFVKENLVFGDSANPLSKLLLTIIGAVAEFERELHLERQREGIAIAQRQGKYRGGKRKLDEKKIEFLKIAMKTNNSKVDLAKEFGVSTWTLTKYMKEING